MDFQAEALSGIYVIDPTSTHNVGFCITVSHVSFDDVLSKYEIQVAAPHFSNKEVLWLDAKVMANIPVFSEPDPLFDHISTCVHEGFNFFPSDTLPKNLSFKSLCVLTLSCEFRLNELNRHFFEDFLIHKATSTSQIIVRSCPFSFTNCTFFADFKSTGHINMVLVNDGIQWGYLSDIKYLDNMIGGLVVNEFSESVGILLGNLRKLNGDGDLVVILPWERLLSKIISSRTSLGKFHHVSPSIANNDNIKPLKFHLKSSIDFSESKIQQENKLRDFSHLPVFPIVFSKEDARISWGSCVLFNSQCLITNTHVMKPFQDRYNTQCEILLDNNSSIFLLNLDKILNPVEHLDLTFILLSPENKHALSKIIPIELSFWKNESSDYVYTVGFGLFLTTSLTPLVSKGHISTLLRLVPFKEPKMAFQSKILCMLITSSSCWNGSSGGGLFTPEGKFLGLVSCNAEVRIPSNTKGNVTRSEKIPLLTFCIPSNLILECYRLTVVDHNTKITLNDDVVKAWNLETYHKDIIERLSKL